MLKQSIFPFSTRVCVCVLESVDLTLPPAVELVLQPVDGVLQRLVLLLLFLPLALPLLGGQLHVQGHRVLYSLRPGEKFEAILICSLAGVE